MPGQTKEGERDLMTDETEDGPRFGDLVDVKARVLQQPAQTVTSVPVVIVRLFVKACQEGYR